MYVYIYTYYIHTYAHVYIYVHAYIMYITGFFGPGQLQPDSNSNPFLTGLALGCGSPLGR